MAKYQIVTDSTSDLTPKLVEELGVTVIPMEFIIGDEVYHNYPDAREMSSKEFYARLRAGEMSKTNQINTITFLETFEPYLQNGLDVLYIGFSSSLSGTYERALEAIRQLKEKYPERRVVPVDSLAVSMGEGLLVYYAARRQQEGATIDEAAEWVSVNRFSLSQYFTVDDLNHLKRGGRLSAAAALFGSMLGIKPVLRIDDEGHLIPAAKVRGRKQSLDTLLNQMEKTIQQPERQTVFIVHCDSPDDAKYLYKQTKSRVHPKEIIVNDLGPILGAHTGPGGIAIFYLSGNRG
mgnify:CR=1 FL=1